MGTDIHCVFQARNNNDWIDIPSQYDERRQYSLFAWLGNVRNGVGFAGVPTHNCITPLQSSRGYPDNFEVCDDTHPITSEALLGWRLKYHRPEDPLEIWMGDHSHGWLTADEILQATPPTIMRTGVISLEDYRAWDGNSQPEDWSGGIWGQGIKISEPQDITGATTHVRVSWLSNLLLEFSDFLTEIKRLKNQHGEVRMVFGFDS